MRISDWSSDVCSSDLARTARGKRAKPAKDVSELPPGRESFAPVQATRRSNPRRRNVRPDPIDLRDWMYQPSIAVAPRDWMLPNAPRRTKHQHQTRSEEHTSEIQSLMRTSYAVFCSNKKKK